MKSGIILKKMTIGMKKILKEFKIKLNMSKSLFILIFLLLQGYFCIAQEDNDRDQIEAVRTAYITNQLKLSPEEAQKFWPLYNNYIQELKKAQKENPDDVVAQQEKLVNIRKKYKNDFKKIIGSDERVNKAFTAEVEFRNMLRNEWRNRHPNGDSDKNNKPTAQQLRKPKSAA